MTQVSVIIPVYNTQAYLEACLSSVSAQTLRDIEMICVDDGSTDGSPDILRRFAAEDGRIRILTQANGGPGAARNAGLAVAKGQYVIFLDSDDWFEADFLEKMVLRARQTQADIVICRAVEFDTLSGRELPSDWMLKERYLPKCRVFSPGDISKHLFQFTYGMAWDKLYRGDFLRRTRLRFPELRNSEDLAFVFPSLIAARRIAVTDEVMVHHRVNRRTSVSNRRSDQPQAPFEAFSIVKCYLEDNGLMSCYERSFLSWAMEFLVWHVSNMDNRNIQRAYYRVLKRVWLPELDFARYPFSYYENKIDYAKYLLVKFAPYSVFCAVLAAYKAGKALALRGKQAAIEHEKGEKHGRIHIEASQGGQAAAVYQPDCGLPRLVAMAQDHEEKGR